MNNIINTLSILALKLYKGVRFGCTIYRRILTPLQYVNSPVWFQIIVDINTYNIAQFEGMIITLCQNREKY